MNILVINNDLAELGTLAERLREKNPGGRVQAFADPLLAVKYGYNHPVDVVYVKSIMRGLNGDDVVRLLRNVHTNIQVEILDT